ncbi:hypothetical protein [Streptomyces sp. A012304]|uniref:hypothetical protein n=1 Tax=Streptomyces sp. A012304 TaxID=375446 RepID=UPI002231222C|nr:hypothetical protein [Streptomyces sp. A012304]GKQ35181.1 hypothetical protein ALMP_17270 [Streptomyces sp. A012304]
MRARALTTLATASLLALTACSSNDSPDNTTASNSPASATVSSSTPAPKELDAQQVVTALTKAITSTKAATVYTAATDPNQLLGRPNGYTSKADFTDSRAKPKLDDEVQNGGSVEIYSDPADAQDRAKYIADTLDKMKIFGTEYHYLNGGILLRVSGALTPDQAAEYEAALKQLS